MTFQRLRDYVDAMNCCTLSSFSREYLLQGFNKAMATEAKEKFKINKVFFYVIIESLNIFNFNVFYYF